MINKAKALRTGKMMLIKKLISKEKRSEEGIGKLISQLMVGNLAIIISEN